MLRFFILALMSFTIGSHAQARVLWVDQQNPIYPTIQHAVDAAASGDTIRIGPGRYNATTIVESGGWLDPVRILVHMPELTLIGAGDGLTIIGPEEPWHLDHGNDRGIVAGNYFGNQRMHIKGIRFENMSHGITLESDGESVVEECVFIGNYRGIESNTGGMTVVDCSFSIQPRDGYHLASLFQAYLVVNGCEFVVSNDSQYVKKNILTQGNTRVECDNTTFQGGSSGMYIYGSTRGWVRNCEFTGQTWAALRIQDSGGSVHSPLVEDCRFIDIEAVALSIATGGLDFTANRLYMENIGSVSIDALGYSANITIHDSHLARGSQFVFRCSERTGGTINCDLRNNWWGTADPDSIRAWINDMNDDPELSALVEFEPFMKEPGVPVTSKSLGDVKSYFR